MARCFYVRFVVIFLIVIFLMDSLFAADSSTETEFNIYGCAFDFEGESVGVSVGECSRGTADGHFFCELDTTPWITTEEGLGCAMGNSDFTSGDDFCCPPGMGCNEVVPGEFKCERREENCFDQEDEDQCEENACIWMDISEECSDGSRDFDCSYYDDQTSCEEDIWNLGATGIGTELCGKTIECAGQTFAIPKSDCGCAWYPLAPEGSKCQMKLVGSQMFYEDSPDKFECSNVYSPGECIDGVQSISWFSSSSVISGFGGGIPEECLVAMGCASGEDSRFCGEPLVKLNGFSVFSLFASFVIIFMFYFFSKR